MLQRTYLGVLAVALAAVLLAGCFAVGRGKPPEEAVVVRVENKLEVPSALTIYAVPETTGAERLLGSVAADGAQVFFFLPGAPGEHRLVARTTGGREIVSDPLTLVPGTTVRWDVQANATTVTQTP